MGANELKGHELIQEVVMLAGSFGEKDPLPKEEFQQELNSLLEANGHDAQSLTIDQLRQSLLLYLESIDEKMSMESAQLEIESGGAGELEGELDDLLPPLPSYIS